MNRPTLRPVVVTTLCGVCVLAAVSAVARRPRERWSWFPSPAATVDEPQRVEPGALFGYTVMVTDKDTRYVGEFPHVTATREPDRTATARPVVLRSVTGPSVRIVSNGTSPDGTTVWAISGRAQDRPGTYLDTWQAYDDRPEGDPRRDTYMEMVQLVRIDGPKPRAADPRRQGRSIHRQAAPNIRTRTRREVLSDALAPKLGDRLTPEERADLKLGHEIAVRIGGLPEPLKQTALDYVRAATTGPIQVGGVSALAFDRCSIVLLPPPSTALGVDTPAGPDGLPTRL